LFGADSENGNIDNQLHATIMVY